MKRRDFLKCTGTVIAAGVLLPWGCGSDSRSSHQSSSPRLYLAGERHLMYDDDDNEYELLPHEHSLERLDADGNVLWSFAGLESEGGIFNYPVEMVPGKNGLLYVLEFGGGEIEVLNKQGAHVMTIGGIGSDDGSLLYPSDLVVNEEGILFVTDSSNHRVQVFDENGTPIRRFGQLGTDGAFLNHPEGIDFDPDGNIHVVDAGNDRVQIYDPMGNHIGSYGSYGSGEGQFMDPGTVVIDENGYRYVSDAVTGYVTIFDHEGSFLERYKPTFPDGTPAVPVRLTLAPNQMLYIYATPGFDEQAFLAQFGSTFA